MFGPLGHTNFVGGVGMDKVGFDHTRAAAVCPTNRAGLGCVRSKDKIGLGPSASYLFTKMLLRIGSDLARVVS